MDVIKEGKFGTEFRNDVRYKYTVYEDCTKELQEINVMVVKDPFPALTHFSWPKMCPRGKITRKKEVHEEREREAEESVIEKLSEEELKHTHVIL